MKMDTTAILQTTLNYAVLSKDRDTITVILSALATQAGCKDSPNVRLLVDELLTSPGFAKLSTISSLWSEVQTPQRRVPIPESDPRPALKQLLDESVNPSVEK